MDGSNAVIGSVVLGTPVTTNVFAVSATPATLIPANAVKFRAAFGIQNNANGDLGSAWFLDANLGDALAFNADPNFIAGDLGTGYTFDSHGFSVRTQLAGNLPTILANPGADTDPVSALGGSTTLTWDTSLADGRFTAYLVERRRQDQQSDDTAWALLATITNVSVGSYTDLTAGGATTYQYGVRQQIQYTDGSVGVSTNRAIVAGSVAFSPAWYLVNSAGQIYNLRLNTVIPSAPSTGWRAPTTPSSWGGWAAPATPGQTWATRSTASRPTGTACGATTCKPCAARSSRCSG